MIEVSKNDFFLAIGGPENIHPTTELDRTIWKNMRSGEVVGRSAQGYVRRHGEVDRYFLVTTFAAQKGVEKSQ